MVFRPRSHLGGSRICRTLWRTLMRLTIVISAALISLAAGAIELTAHHSFAPHFDASKPVNISGTVIMFEGRNPHSSLHVSASDENGRTREYICESHGVTQLSRIGITPQ